MNKSRKIPTLTQAQKATRRKKRKEEKGKKKTGVGGGGGGEGVGGGGAQDKNTLPVWTTKQTWQKGSEVKKMTTLRTRMSKDEWKQRHANSVFLFKSLD